MTAKLVEEAKLLEDAGASLLDFTNSGPVAGAAVVKAGRDPGDRRLRRRSVARWADAPGARRHRLRGKMVRIRRPRPTPMWRSITLDAFTALIDDVRAGRQIKGGTAMATAIIDGIATRYEVLGSGPAAADVCAGRLRRDRREVVDARRLRAHQAARPSAEEIHLHRVRPARVRPVGRPRRAHDLGALCGAGQGPARSPRHQARPPHGRLHGLLPGAGLRRGLSAGHAEHGAVLAGRRRQIPDQQPPAFCRASRVCAAARPRRKWWRWSPRTASRSAPIRAAGRGPR